MSNTDIIFPHDFTPLAGFLMGALIYCPDITSTRATTAAPLALHDGVFVHLPQ